MKAKRTKPNYPNRELLALLVNNYDQSQVNPKSFQSMLKNVIASPE
ncbi:hypothetical protein RYH73_19405 [Olivibacter sp. CPCC 100613]